MPYRALLILTALLVVAVTGTAFLDITPDASSLTVDNDRRRAEQVPPVEPDWETTDRTANGQHRTWASAETLPEGSEPLHVWKVATPETVEPYQESDVYRRQLADGSYEHLIINTTFSERAPAERSGHLAAFTVEAGEENYAEPMALTDADISQVAEVWGLPALVRPVVTAGR